jgi:hypothetical protein
MHLEFLAITCDGEVGVEAAVKPVMYECVIADKVRFVGFRLEESHVECETSAARWDEAKDDLNEEG